ncbi:MAG: GIY-YIG nuclease family protein [Nitrosopumilus sp.]|uniref:GIY-YIG nuclease family protein n=1 Tax=Nitrosopumilus sp. TaxID=2024843 RepID=UPI0024310AAA|nr:GIY-YIG nuclease family protein [Nitrosopumilus sp.]MCV0366980.1 GIY-YIG nuclease family protein [Nitrosopumilus sp.]
MELLEDKMRVWLESAKFVKPASGVYVLYNRNKEPIYIGETDNLEETFTKYVDTNFEGNECKQKTQSYQRVFLENPKEFQTKLIEDFKNETGKMPSCNSEIQLETH